MSSSQSQRLAAGTSDRLLIDHFGSREMLIETILDHLASRLKSGLDQAVPAELFRDRDTAVNPIMALSSAPEFRRFNAVWFAILARAAANHKAYRETTQRIITDFADWIEPRVPRSESDRRAAACLLLTLIEGLVVMDAANQARQSNG